MYIDIHSINGVASFITFDEPTYLLDPRDIVW